MRPERFFGYVVIVFIALLLVSEGLLYVPGARNHITISENLSINDGTVNINEAVYSTFSANFGESYYITNGTLDFSTIYFYYDDNYPSSQSTIANWYGLSQHLQSIISARSLGTSIVILNASQLQYFLSNPADSRSILVLASGVFPDSVYSLGLNLVEPWILKGGTLFWIGDRIGELTGFPHTGTSTPETMIMPNNAMDIFINSSLLGGNSSYYSKPSKISISYGLNYSYCLPGNGVDAARLTQAGGTAIGAFDGSYTNIAVLPSGRGHIVYLAGPLLDDTTVSTSIMNIIESNLVNMVLLANSSSLEVHPYVHTNISLTLDVPMSYLYNNYEFDVYSVQIDHLGTYALIKTIRL